MNESQARYRPSRPLTLPLQTGAGFATSLFMWGFAWMPSLALTAAGLLTLLHGHWIVGPILALLGAFFMGAFWSFPREVWIARPCDLELDAHGFRVVGGHHAGVKLSWDELDAEACELRDGAAVLSQQLVAVTRKGQRVPVAEGEEHDSFRAVLNVWRASAGLEPLDERARAKQQKKRKKQHAEAAPSGESKRAYVTLVSCAKCGAAACPRDSETTPCRYCSEAVAMPQDLRQRLRDVSMRTKLKRKSEKLLERLLAQPRARVTMALMGVLALAMLAAWLFGAFAFARSFYTARLDLPLVLLALVAPLLMTVSLACLASLVAVRRVAVRAVAVDFAAIAPAAPGKPCSCRVCGAPLPELELPVVRCAYCSSFNVVSCARPRAPSRAQDQVKSLEETLDSQSAEHIVRWVLIAFVGAPALWGAAAALQALWLKIS